ncbi:hypothetical protein SKAU_G00225940 [Synaphobranchus kaupii]|uniref:Uncharacterized protein n=1 Tax=Synaphobranchus kaupii TaxID=118154 RepID=A0A9Q1FBV4_SYNKA|nr:hypothetical protein SKAU_G00225940 [Synaphobranchus kaupii]
MVSVLVKPLTAVVSVSARGVTAAGSISVSCTAESTVSRESAGLLWRHILSALVLLAAIGLLIEHFISHTPITDQLEKPEISVQISEGIVDIACETKLRNSTCNLYIGDSPELYSSKNCVIHVEFDELKQALQAVGTREVSCDYTVKTDPHSRSPRSDRKEIPGESLSVLSLENMVTR